MTTAVLPQAPPAQASRRALTFYSAQTIWDYECRVEQRLRRLMRGTACVLLVAGFAAVGLGVYIIVATSGPYTDSAGAAMLVTGLALLFLGLLCVYSSIFGCVWKPDIYEPDRITQLLVNNRRIPAAARDEIALAHELHPDLPMIVRSIILDPSAALVFGPGDIRTFEVWWRFGRVNPVA